MKKMKVVKEVERFGSRGFWLHADGGSVAVEVDKRGVITIDYNPLSGPLETARDALFLLQSNAFEVLSQEVSEEFVTDAVCVSVDHVYGVNAHVITHRIYVSKGESLGAVASRIAEAHRAVYVELGGVAK